MDEMSQIPREPEKKIPTGIILTTCKGIDLSSRGDKPSQYNSSKNRNNYWRTQYPGITKHAIFQQFIHQAENKQKVQENA